MFTGSLIAETNQSIEAIRKKKRHIVAIGHINSKICINIQKKYYISKSTLHSKKFRDLPKLQIFFCGNSA